MKKIDFIVGKIMAKFYSVNRLIKSMVKNGATKEEIDQFKILVEKYLVK